MNSSLLRKTYKFDIFRRRADDLIEWLVIAALKILCIFVLAAIWTFLAVKGSTEERYPQLETLVAAVFYAVGCKFCFFGRQRLCMWRTL